MILDLKFIEDCFDFDFLLGSINLYSDQMFLHR
jgi:hypothetical protein